MRSLIVPLIIPIGINSNKLRNPIANVFRTHPHRLMSMLPPDEGPALRIKLGHAGETTMCGLCGDGEALADHFRMGNRKLAIAPPSARLASMIVP
jgi:hypothetical protein